MMKLNGINEEPEFELLGITITEVADKTCRTCIYRQRWINHYSPKVTQRCGLQKTRGKGLKKIKVTNKACAGYKEAQKEVWNEQRRNYKRIGR